MGGDERANVLGVTLSVTESPVQALAEPDALAADKLARSGRAAADARASLAQEPVERSAVVASVVIGLPPRSGTHPLAKCADIDHEPIDALAGAGECGGHRRQSLSLGGELPGRAMRGRGECAPGLL